MPWVAISSSFRVAASGPLGAAIASGAAGVAVMGSWCGVERMGIVKRVKKVRIGWGVVIRKPVMGSCLRAQVFGLGVEQYAGSAVPLLVFYRFMLFFKLLFL